MKDTFGRTITYLRLSVTDLCNLRCQYCMPAEGIAKSPHDTMLTEEEMVDAVRAAADLGVRKVRLTGGEPLVKRNILSICENISKIEQIGELCMTTNGVLLTKMAQDLKSCGLNRLNISLDTLRADRFAEITRGGRLSEVLDGIEAALSCGFDKIKLNVVLQKGVNDDEIEDLAAFSVKQPIDVRFIELMPMEGGMGNATFLSADAVLEALPLLSPVEDDGGVAKLYRLPDAKGNIGLIRPISQHFCKSCNRLRITADGMIKPCLHSAGEYSLKGLSREQMREQLCRAIFEKPEQHNGLQQKSCAGRRMHQIGG